MSDHDSHIPDSPGDQTTRSQAHSEFSDSDSCENSGGPPSGHRNPLIRGQGASSPGGRESHGTEFQELERIGRFHVIRRLGAGGFGTVFQAYDPRLKRRVAIKVPAGRIRTNPSLWQSFVDEARVLAELDHPAIVRVHDIGRFDTGMPFVVMEYVKGPTLEKYVQRVPLVTH